MNETHTNLLVIMTDEQRWDALGCAGNSTVKTPNIDRLARQGAYFDNAYTPCPVCVPARTSILTGCPIEQTGIKDNLSIGRGHYEPDHPIRSLKTFDEILALKGFHTEYHGKWHSPPMRAREYQNWPVSVAGRLHNEEAVAGSSMKSRYQAYLSAHVPKRLPAVNELVEVFSGHPYMPCRSDERLCTPQSQWRDAQGRNRATAAGSVGQLLLPARHSVTAFHAKETLAALERVKDGRPFAITCSFATPHTPLVATEPYFSMYEPARMALWKNFADAMRTSPYRAQHAFMKTRFTKVYQDEDCLREIIAIYYGLVTEIDDWTGQILDKLEQIGAAQNTLVVFTSDHGSMLGSHGLWNKGVFYEEATRVPLILRLPGLIPERTRIAQPVTLLSLFPTILDYCVGDVSKHHEMANRLRLTIDGDSLSGEPFVVCQWEDDRFPAFMVRSRRWKLMFGRSHDSASIDALYDLDHDPNEMNNLLAVGNLTNQAAAQAEQLKSLLVSWLKKVDSKHLHGVRSRTIAAPNGPIPTAC